MVVCYFWLLWKAKRKQLALNAKQPEPWGGGGDGGGGGGAPRQALGRHYHLAAVLTIR